MNTKDRLLLQQEIISIQQKIDSLERTKEILKTTINGNNNS